MLSKRAPGKESHWLRSKRSETWKYWNILTLHRGASVLLQSALTTLCLLLQYTILFWLLAENYNLILTINCFVHMKRKQKKVIFRGVNTTSSSASCHFPSPSHLRHLAPSTSSLIEGEIVVIKKCIMNVLRLIIKVNHLFFLFFCHK